MVMLSVQPEAPEPSYSQNKNPGNALSRYQLPRILSVSLMPDCCSDYFPSTSCIPRRLLDLCGISHSDIYCISFMSFKLKSNLRTQRELQPDARSPSPLGWGGR